MVVFVIILESPPTTPTPYQHNPPPLGLYYRGEQ